MNIRENFVRAACISLFFPTMAMAEPPNPATQTWVLEQIASHGTAQGAYTSSAWVSACSGGAAGLLAGCLTDYATVEATPLRSMVDPMWYSMNTTPASVANSIYIKKFPAGYVFTANSARSLTYDATGIPGSSSAICTRDPITESGVDLDDGSVNNNPTAVTGTRSIYNVSSYASFLVSGGTATYQMLRDTPGSLGAMPLMIPIYVVCIGINRYTGSPASIAGLTIS